MGKGERDNTASRSARDHVEVIGDGAAAKKAVFEFGQDGCGKDTANSATVDRQDAEQAALRPWLLQASMLDRAVGSARRNVVHRVVSIASPRWCPAWRPPPVQRPVINQSS